MDGTDADGEWSDEELLQSGSQTGVSETEQEEGYRLMTSRAKTPFSATSPLYGHHISPTGADPTRTQQTGVDHTRTDHTSTMATGTTSVDLILDKIDAELEAMDLADSKSPWELNTGDKATSGPPRPDSSRSRSAPVGCADSANGGTASSSPGSNYGYPSVSSQMYGPAEVYRGTGPMNGYSSPRSNLDVPSDLDPQSAHQIDMKFKEIMRKKKDPQNLFSLEQIKKRDNSLFSESPRHLVRLPRCNSTGASPGQTTRKVHIQEPFADATYKPLLHQEPALHSDKTAGSLSSRLRTRSGTRPSATMLSTGYGTDNESVKTEEFETRFMGLMVAPTDTERVDAPVSCTDFKPPTGHTKRYNKFKTPGSPPGLTPQDEELLQRLVRISEETKASHPQSIISRPRSLSPTRMRGEKKVVTIQQDGHNEREKERDKVRADREMERERRARSVSPPPRETSLARDSSTPPTFISDRPFTPSLVSTYPAKYESSVNTLFGCKTGSHVTDADYQKELQDLKTLRQALIKTRHDLTEAERSLLDARELAEDAKSGLKTLEFTRGNATKDLERLKEDIKRKEGQLTSLDSELQTKLQDLKNMSSMGVSREDCLEVKLVKEENQSLKARLRSIEGLELERNELVRQLDSAKEDLFREQKHGRLQTAELQEDIENLTCKLEETQNAWTRDKDQLVKLEQAFRRMEREKNELIQGKASEYESLKASFKDEASESHVRMRKELIDLENEVKELRVRIGDLDLEITSKDALVENLRQQVNDLQAAVTREKQERQKASMDYKNNLHLLKKEMSAAAVQLKESMFLEKQRAIEDIKSELEQERRASAASTEDRLQQLMEEHNYQMEVKDGEILRLQDAIRRQESQLQAELELQVREAVDRAQDLAEQDKVWQLRKEQEASNQRTSELSAQLEKDKLIITELQAQLGTLQKELGEQRRQQREASKDKLLAVSKAKEQMKQQNSVEMERIKFNIQQEHEQVLERLQEQVRDQENELSNLSAERDAALERERNLLQALEHTERTVIYEVNEECQKASRLLGISPRTVHHTSLSLESTEARMNLSNKIVPVISTALTNLRSCNEELYCHTAELHQEVDTLQGLVDKVVKEKDDAMTSLKLELEKQKTLELERMKEMLLKEHVHEMSKVIRDCAETNNQLKTNSEHIQRFGDAALLEALQAKDEELRSLQQTMVEWKNEMEEKFNTQLQLKMAKEREKYQAVQHHSTREQNRINDLQKREIERLENELHKLSLTKGPNIHTPGPPLHPKAHNSLSADPMSTQSSRATSPTNIKPSQQYLQSRIQQLQTDNAALRKQRLLTNGHLNWSTPDLTNTKAVRPTSPKGRPRSPTRDPEAMYRLGERIRIGEQEALKAEERARLNQKIMNNKMVEMAKLQSTLINQNQELQELERAYNDLHKHYNSRPCSPSRNLNTTV
ncbi:unnamed protein product [Lymnaea stagnalis]|uniref:Uncharacterized protein n=1 Tax=Lymnaea stagnalis TaxID=6523 RepID=A0AAV2H3Y8_LYMST